MSSPDPTTPEREGRALARDLASLPLDPKDERAIDKTARWMGMLGRFEVLSGALVLLLAVVLSLGWGFSSMTRPEVESETTPPLVRLGEVSSLQMAIAIGLTIVVGGLVLRAGILFTDAAEDLEHHVHAKQEGVPYLEDALLTLARAFVLDALLLGLVTLGLAWLGSLS